jgi:hypothetical protein
MEDRAGATSILSPRPSRTYGLMERHSHNRVRVLSCGSVDIDESKEDNGDDEDVREEFGVVPKDVDPSRWESPSHRGRKSRSSTPMPGSLTTRRCWTSCSSRIRGGKAPALGIKTSKF